MYEIIASTVSLPKDRVPILDIGMRRAWQPPGIKDACYNYKLCLHTISLENEPPTCKRPPGTHRRKFDEKGLYLYVTTLQGIIPKHTKGSHSVFPWENKQRNRINLITTLLFVIQLKELERILKVALRVFQFHLLNLAWIYERCVFEKSIMCFSMANAV